tara:strand:+ start:108 stop:770 length:663 start_codon:yes stop_codon:yes gene_type:complete
MKRGNHNMKNLKYTLIIMFAAIASGCVTPPEPYDWTAFEEVKPKSILILPVLNNTVDVDAPLFALSTLSVPLGEKGYYAFPINTVKTTLEQEGLYEGEAIKMLGTPVLASMFGADSVLYVEINKWDAQYAFIATTVTVSIDYKLEDTLGRQIWSETVSMQYQPQNNSTGNPLADLVAAAITAGIERAAPNYIPLMNQANHKAFVTGHRALPTGPYAKVKK